MRPLTPKHIAWICAGLGGVLFVIVVFSLKVGAYPIAVSDVVMTLLRGTAAIFTGHWGSIPPTDKLVVFGLRLPRIALGVLVGAALSVSGASFQALLRNPLADPYVLGVSSGAALGAICSLAWFPRFPWTMQALAFVGALLTITAVYFLGRRGGQLDSTTLLLAGIIAASFLSAIIMFLMTTVSGRDLRGMAFWLMGDLATPPALRLRFLFIVLLLAIGAIYTTASDLNLILTGEREAHHLGVNVARVKLVVYVGASLLTGLAVSVSGAIGYVGLLIPHVIRMLFGSDYRLLIPASALGGAIAVCLADTLARTIVAPTELPVGAMTAAIGAPVFIYLLRRRLT
ncbi:MAG: iron ABC transporter permease [Candidatus Acidiferrales bacterium]